MPIFYVAAVLLLVAEDDGIMATGSRFGGHSVDFQPMSPEDIEWTMQFC
jgi:hypothetical protein